MGDSQTASRVTLWRRCARCADAVESDHPSGRKHAFDSSKIGWQKATKAWRSHAARTGSAARPGTSGWSVSRTEAGRPYSTSPRVGESTHTRPHPTWWRWWSVPESVTQLGGRESCRPRWWGADTSPLIVDQWGSPGFIGLTDTKREPFDAGGQVIARDRAFCPPAAPSYCPLLRPPFPAGAAVVLTCDEFPLATEDGVGGGKGREFAEGLPSERLPKAS